MSSSKDSFPYKMYSDMRLEFWRNQINLQMKQSKHNSLIINMATDNVSNIPNTSSRRTSKLLNSNSDSSSTLNDNENLIKKPKITEFLNTSVNNESSNPAVNNNLSVLDPSSSKAIPMSVHMSTQCNSDMKIVIEQDSTDQNVVNIKFGGTFTGSLRGSGTIPQDKLLTLINKGLKDKTQNEIDRPKVVVKTFEQSQDIKSKPLMHKSQSVGSEESVGYFASVKPVNPFLTNQKSSMKSAMNQDADNITTSINPKSGRSSMGSTSNYNERYSRDRSLSFRMPTIALYTATNFLPKSPAVLPTCIIRRIVRAMLAELPRERRKVFKKIKQEAKVNTLTNRTEILHLNWHDAIKRGKIMVGELLELILSVNIDGVCKSLEDIEPVLLELKNEFIGCCIYLSVLTDRTQFTEHMCLEFIIDIMLDEIDRLLQLFTEWMQTKMDTDFSAYFIKDFTNKVSPNNSERLSQITTESETIASESFVEKQSKSLTDQLSEFKNANSRTQRRSQLSESIHSKRSSTKDDFRRKSLKHMQNVNDNDMSIERQSIYYDPSIITNSRITKTMKTISQSAIEQKIEKKWLSKESRNEMIALEIINKQIILKKNPNVSLLKELNNETELWKAPISAGRNSIQDLIEFIINTITQDKESTKELYLDITNELEKLEKDLLLSVGNNLHFTRIANDDLHSLCYEILAEIIYEEISVAKYIFNKLEPIGVENLMLGKLYRNYTAENSDMRNTSKLDVTMTHPISNSYAHLTSEITNYAETDFAAQQQISAPQESFIANNKNPDKLSQLKKASSLGSSNKAYTASPKIASKNSLEKFTPEHSATVNTVNPEMIVTKQQVLPKKVPKIQTKLIAQPIGIVKAKNSTENALLPNESSTENQTTDTEIKNPTHSNPQNPPLKTNNSNDKLNNIDGNEQLLLILNKLHKQTSEINRIKGSLHSLSNSVDEKLSNWSCNFVAPSIDKYRTDKYDPQNAINYGKTTQIFNALEVVPAPLDLLINIQPSKVGLIPEIIEAAKKVENKSFIAPISNKTNEEQVKTPNANIPKNSPNSTDFDIFQLIGDGAHNYLTSKQIYNNVTLPIRKQDSCDAFNTEFDRIFEWIVDKYQDTLGAMKANSASKKIIEAMETAPMDEKRKIERELINRIIDHNNLSIDTWVKDICFHKVLNYLS